MQRPTERAPIGRGSAYLLHMGASRYPQWEGALGSRLLIWLPRIKGDEMKKCSYCGRKHTDETTVCSIDGHSLVECEIESDAPKISNESNHVIPFTPPRSGWATLLRFLGILSFLGAGVVMVFALNREATPQDSIYIPVGICLVGGVQGFLFAFLIDVFTDTRWFVEKLAQKFEAVPVEQIKNPQTGSPVSQETAA